MELLHKVTATAREHRGLPKERLRPGADPWQEVCREGLLRGSGAARSTPHRLQGLVLVS